LNRVEQGVSLLSQNPLTVAIILATLPADVSPKCPKIRICEETVAYFGAEDGYSWLWRSQSQVENPAYLSLQPGPFGKAMGRCVEKLPRELGQMDLRHECFFSCLFSLASFLVHDFGQPSWLKQPDCPIPPLEVVHMVSEWGNDSRLVCGTFSCEWNSQHPQYCADADVA
jgi:hypothetical protein